MQTEHRDLVLSRLEVGAMFGETCVFSDLRRGWLVKSLTPCELYVTAKDLFVEHAEYASGRASPWFRGQGLGHAEYASGRASPPLDPRHPPACAGSVLILPPLTANPLTPKPSPV